MECVQKLSSSWPHCFNSASASITKDQRGAGCLTYQPDKAFDKRRQRKTESYSLHYGTSFLLKIASPERAHRTSFSLKDCPGFVKPL